MSGDKQRIFLYGSSWLLNTPQGWTSLSRENAIALVGEQEVQKTELLQKQGKHRSLLEVRLEIR